MPLTDEQTAFGRAVAPPDAEIDLGRAALLLASVFNPGLDVEPYVRELEMMAAALADRSSAFAGGRATLGALVRYLVVELGFRGNSNDYEDPRNSYLSDVLDRRLGIPITLSVVFIEVARRGGLVLDGVGYPGHFLVRWTDKEGMTEYLDPFHEGREVTEAELLNGLVRTGLEVARARSFLTAVTKRQILTRMLTNLKVSFTRHGLLAQALDAVALLLIMNPWDLDERRDRGLMAVPLGDLDLAVSEMETYLTYRADAEDAQEVRRQLELARQGRSARGSAHSD